MSRVVDDELRAVFGGIIDILIPEAEGMPSALQVEVHRAMLDRILVVRPDLKDALLRGLQAALGVDPRIAIREMQQDDGEAYIAIGLAASAGYYMTPRVRELIGYPGQERRPLDQEPRDEYAENPALRRVIERGPIYRPTPK